MLTIAADSSFVTKGQTIKVFAALKNQSGESHNIAHWGLMGWFIPGWRVDSENPDNPPLTDSAPPSRFCRFENDTSLHFSFSILVEDQEPGVQEPGVYELQVSGLFSLVFDSSG